MVRECSDVLVCVGVCRLWKLLLQQAWDDPSADRPEDRWNSVQIKLRDVGRRWGSSGVWRREGGCCGVVCWCAGVLLACDVASI